MSLYLRFLLRSFGIKEAITDSTSIYGLLPILCIRFLLTFVYPISTNPLFQFFFIKMSLKNEYDKGLGFSPINSLGFQNVISLSI